MGTKSTKYPPEVQAWAVRTVLGRRCEHPSEWAAITSIATRIGFKAQILRHGCEGPSGIRARELA